MKRTKPRTCRRCKKAPARSLKAKYCQPCQDAAKREAKRKWWNGADKPPIVAPEPPEPAKTPSNEGGRIADERDVLIGVLSKIWPAHLHVDTTPSWTARHPHHTLVLCVHSPVGVLPWHVSNELQQTRFGHLKLESCQESKTRGKLRYEALERLETRVI